MFTKVLVIDTKKNPVLRIIIIGLEKVATTVARSIGERTYRRDKPDRGINFLGWTQTVRCY